MSTAPSSLSTTTKLEHDFSKCEVVIIRTAWNDDICTKLIDGACKVLAENNCDVAIHTVPGCVELPFAVMHYERSHPKLSPSKRAYIAFGCVIQGETPHFEYVCKAVTNGITQLNITLLSPVIFGVLTVMHEKQAYDRLGGSQGHKGEEAALSALKMMQFMANC
jgi:6,7-dimethyl-8-ribityllumazine synthase